MSWAIDTGDVPVTDPGGAAADPAMPFLAAALDPGLVGEQFAMHLTNLGGSDGPRPRLLAIRVVRHKPGRRCLVEYTLAAGNDGAAVTILGKARAKGLDERAHRLARTLWAGEFGPAGTGAARVPEPLGAVRAFRMWFQRKVPGVAAGRPLAEPGGAALAAALADAVHQLHRARVPADRSHTLADELLILHDRLAAVAVLRPLLSGQVARLRDACDRAAADARPLSAVGVHRDFYPDQVLVNVSGGGRRIYLLDLDLYSEGDPALDVGNFGAHLTELALRTTGDPSALADREQAMADRFTELADRVGEPADRVRKAVATYAALALARHVWISTRFPERQPFTERLLVLAIRRLAAEQ